MSVGRIIKVTALLLFLVGCGSDGSGDPPAPAEPLSGAVISSASLKDANGTTITATGSTSIIPSSFELTLSLEGPVNYSIASNGNLVTTDPGTETSFGSVSLACGSLTPTISAADSGTAEHTYTITVSEAWRYGYMDCTLSVSVDEGSEYPAAVTSFAFRNAPAINDDFNAQTISDDGSSGWLVSTVETLTSVAGMAGILDINASESIMDIDFTGSGGNSVALTKSVNVSGDFELEMYFKSVSGWNVNGPSGSSVHLMLKRNLDYYAIGIGGFSAGNAVAQSCLVKAGLESQTPSTYYHVCSASTGYYVKLTKSGSTFTQQYKVEGGEYQNLDLDSGTPTWQDIGLSGALSLVLRIDSAAGGDDEKAQIGWIKLSGMTVEGQY